MGRPQTKGTLSWLCPAGGALLESAGLARTHQERKRATVFSVGGRCQAILWEDTAFYLLSLFSCVGS